MAYNGVIWEVSKGNYPVDHWCLRFGTLSETCPLPLQNWFLTPTMGLRPVRLISVMDATPHAMANPAWERAHVLSIESAPNGANRTSPTYISSNKYNYSSIGKVLLL